MMPATEVLYPCKPATIQELEEKFSAAINPLKADQSLGQYLHSVTIQEVDWRKAHHIKIFYNQAFQVKDSRDIWLSDGIHVSHDGSWLLILLPQGDNPESYLAHCTPCLQTLWVNNCNAVTQFLNLETLTQLTELRLWSCQSLTTLQGLEKLTQLIKLDLRFSSSLTALPGLEMLTQLTELNLSFCSRLTTLPALERLTQLTDLDFWHCYSLTALPGLEMLTQLSKLNLGNCSRLTALPGLERLTQLTVLNLARCGSLNTLPNLEMLTQLTELNLHDCHSLTTLSGLENLKQLTELTLDGCHNLIAMSGLENLTQLTVLNLEYCHNLTALPGLESLTQLTVLNLKYCRNLTALPGLENLKQLTELDLRYCLGLTALPGLENLKLLTTLCLDSCVALTELPELENLTQLVELDLSGCTNLQELPLSLQHFTSLRRLSLDAMELRTLPYWLLEISENFTLERNDDYGENKAIVSLEDTTVEDIPDMSIFEQPFEVIEEFFRKRREGQTQMLNEIKVVFLGDGEAGKSHTIARLMNDGGEPVDYTDQATPGIIIKHKDYTVDDRTFRVNYWDFGGQEIMHSMHRIFLTGRTMYVVLLNARDDTQSDRAKYWLHNIHSFAPSAPILLVLNKVDQNPNASVDERDLRGRCERLTQVVKLSALKDSQEAFNENFTEVLKQEILNTGYLNAEWPTAWKHVKEKLENMESHYIMGDAYEDICLECHVDTNQENLLHWFNDLGVSFCCCDKEDYALEEYVILRPDWITNALYIILFNKLEGRQNGLIPHRAIYDILRSARSNPNIHCTLPNARYTSGDIGYVLGVMRKFNLSLPHGTEHEFIPMLCQQNSTVDIQYYHRDTDTLEFNMEFDYLPNNLLHRLMVERHSELDMDNVWRTGAKFQLPELGLSAVVVIDSNTLRFFIRHDNDSHRPNTYLTMLKANVDRIVAQMGLKAPACKLIYKLDGKRDEFDYEDVKLSQELGDTHINSKTHRRKILIMDILNQSAPDGLVDEQKLLDAIRKSCLNIQAEPEYYLNNNKNGRGLEDKRNRRIRSDLEMVGYNVKDQTQRGLSETGRSVGELDLLLYNDRKEPWTIIEALRISSGTKTDWNEHLDKLVNNYNYFGAPCVYLLTYVDADPDAFQRIWEGYQLHIPKHAPGKFTYCTDSLITQEDAHGSQYVKTAKCRYDHGGIKTTAYHIFARMPTQNG